MKIVKSKILYILLAFFAIFVSNVLTAAQVENPRVQWLKGKCGIMVHWLFPKYLGQDSTQIDKIGENFDLAAFMKDFDATGAEWLIFTIGQNTGGYASPNSVIEKYSGKGHTTKRDIVLEVAKAVKERGKHFIAYIPCEIRGNKSMIEGFTWSSDIQNPQDTFQKRWVEVLREWSLRYGKYCDGWWVDGAYADIAPHIYWQLWHDALRAGNPNSAITFNPGLMSNNSTIHLHPDHDYTAGEFNVIVDGKIRMNSSIDNPSLWIPTKTYLNPTKLLWHTLLPIDSFWGAYSNWSDWCKAPWAKFDSASLKQIRPPVYDTKVLQKFVNDFTKIKGAVTLNLGITEDGRLSPASISQVKIITDALKANK